MKLHVTPLSKNARYAKSYGRDHTKATDEPTWIKVEIAHQGAFKVEKAVTFVSGN